MKLIDLPPVWLALFVVIVWLQPTYYPTLSFGGGWADFLGGLCVGGGIVIVALAILQFRRHQTTINPHGEASALIQTGVYRRSRNPIYVADTLILIGLILRWDAVLCLPLIPIFVWIIEKRFVVPEEKRLRLAFKKQFAAYERKVRRWL